MSKLILMLSAILILSCAEQKQEDPKPVVVLDGVWTFKDTKGEEGVFAEGVITISKSDEIAEGDMRLTGIGLELLYPITSGEIREGSKIEIDLYSSDDARMHLYSGTFEEGQITFEKYDFIFSGGFYKSENSITLIKK